MAHWSYTRTKVKWSRRLFPNERFTYESEPDQTSLPSSESGPGAVPVARLGLNSVASYRSCVELPLDIPEINVLPGPSLPLVASSSAEGFESPGGIGRGSGTGCTKAPVAGAWPMYERTLYCLLAGLLIAVLIIIFLLLDPEALFLFLK